MKTAAISASWINLGGQQWSTKKKSIRKAHRIVEIGRLAAKWANGYIILANVYRFIV